MPLANWTCAFEVGYWGQALRKKKKKKREQKKHKKKKEKKKI